MSADIICYSDLLCICMWHVAQFGNIIIKKCIIAYTVIGGSVINDKNLILYNFEILVLYMSISVYAA